MSEDKQVTFLGLSEARKAGHDAALFVDGIGEWVKGVTKTVSKELADLLIGSGEFIEAKAEKKDEKPPLDEKKDEKPSKDEKNDDKKGSN